VRNRNSNVKWTIKGTVFVAFAAVFGTTFTTASAYAAEPYRLTPPPVPAGIEAPPQTELFLIGHGVGTQNYVCAPSGSGVAFALFTPEATLFTDRERQLTTHFFSPNPFEGGTIRATWEDSRDTSMVWGAVTHQSTDAPFVAKGAIAWLAVQIVGAAEGPTGGDTLTKTIFMQRLNTAGGVAPTTGCSVPTDLGNKAFVPYTADYLFYKSDTDDRYEN
jgi:hypothetical protein